MVFYTQDTIGRVAKWSSNKRNLIIDVFLLILGYGAGESYWV